MTVDVITAHCNGTVRDHNPSSKNKRKVTEKSIPNLAHLCMRTYKNAYTEQMTEIHKKNLGQLDALYASHDKAAKERSKEKADSAPCFSVFLKEAHTKAAERLCESVVAARPVV